MVKNKVTPNLMMIFLLGFGLIFAITIKKEVFPEFESDWVRYDHEDGLLFTDAPVLITERGATFRGGGFRYYVRESRFSLLGGATVVSQ